MAGRGGRRTEKVGEAAFLAHEADAHAFLACGGGQIVADRERADLGLRELGEREEGAREGGFGHAGEVVGLVFVPVARAQQLGTGGGVRRPAFAGVMA